MNLEELIDKRLLIKDETYATSINPTEVIILELSPSKQWIKLQNSLNLKYWVKATSINVIEILNQGN